MRVSCYSHYKVLSTQQSPRAGMRDAITETGLGNLLLLSTRPVPAHCKRSPPTAAPTQRSTPTGITPCGRTGPARCTARLLQLLPRSAAPPHPDRHASNWGQQPTASSSRDSRTDSSPEHGRSPNPGSEHKLDLHIILLVGG